MNRYVRITLAFLLVAMIIGIIIVARNNTSNDVVAPQKKPAKTNGDATLIALDLFRQGSELPQFRDALNLISPNLTRPDVAARLVLKPDDRMLLEAEAKLTP